MKRIVMMAVSVMLALTMAAPMVLAQGQGGAPGDAGFTLEIKPGDFPGTCDFPVLLETSGKGKAIELLDLHRFRGLFETENSARKGEHCHEQTRPTHRSFAEKLSGWLELPMRSILSPGSPVRSVSPMAPFGAGSTRTRLTAASEKPGDACRATPVPSIRL